MDDTPKEKAPKHPLGALPPSTIPIDEWKRQYSNNETDVALKWFWEHYDPKEFSLWRVDYKVLMSPLTRVLSTHPSPVIDVLKTSFPPMSSPLPSPHKLVSFIISCKSSNIHF
jgi:hypothetical protein